MLQTLARVPGPPGAGQLQHRPGAGEAQGRRRRAREPSGHVRRSACPAARSRWAPTPTTRRRRRPTGSGSTASRSTPTAVTNAAVRGVRRRDRLRDGGRAAARPGRLSRSAAGEPRSRARWCSPRPAGRSTCATSASGGPGPRAPAGRTRGAGQLGRRAARTTRSCTSPTRTPRPTPPGPARRCPPRPSGSTPPAAGSTGAAFTWGDEARPGGRIMANTWDGPDFPWRSTGESGWSCAPRRSGSFPANGFGLFDMAGNVWEWTDDWWTEPPPRRRRDRRAAPRRTRAAATLEASYDPAQPQFRIGRKVIKGGSHLCADTYCLRYRPAARRPQMIDTGMSHLGFRCVADGPRDHERSTPMTDRPAAVLAPGRDPRRRPRVPRRGADVPPERPGRLLRQRRHAVVRAPDLRPVRLLRRRAETRGARPTRAGREAGVRRPAQRRPRRHRRARARADRARPDRPLRGHLAGGVHAPGARLHGHAPAPDAGPPAAQQRLPADARAHRRAAAARLHGHHRHRRRHRVRAGRQPGPVRRTRPRPSSAR